MFFDLLQNRCQQECLSVKGGTYHTYDTEKTFTQKVVFLIYDIDFECSSPWLSEDFLSNFVEYQALVKYKYMEVNMR